MFLFLALLLPLAAERQVTFTPYNHALDNNDNYSADDRWLCFDTRATLGKGSGASASIMKVDWRAGTEAVVYEPKPYLFEGDKMAPGVIAASFHPQRDEIAFIHGPFLSEAPKLGYYARTNRRGAVVNGQGRLSFLDLRDVTSEVTPPGAHRGGTHRHEYSGDGKRVGFTYDDHLLTQYGRTIGMLVPSAKAPAGAKHWFVILASVVPEAMAKPGDLISANYDSWVGTRGLRRAFVGRVKDADGQIRSSLFVADIPENVDVTTATAGTRDRFPTPPRGVRVRRLTQTDITGIVRGSPDGKRIAYFQNDAQGVSQLFVIAADGSEAQGTQVTQLAEGTKAAVRWHPSGRSVAVATDHGVAVVCVQPGALFGKSVFVTRHGKDVPLAEALVWSRKGTQLAFNRRVAHESGKKDAMGLNFLQIFTVEFEDANGNGIADSIER